MKDDSQMSGVGPALDRGTSGWRLLPLHTPGLALSSLFFRPKSSRGLHERSPHLLEGSLLVFSEDRAVLRHQDAEAALC